MKRKILLFGSGVVVVVALTVWQFAYQRHIVTVDPKVRESFGAAIIIPSASSPHDRVIKPPEYQPDKKIVLAEYQLDQHIVTVSQQKRPTGISLEQINTQEKYLAAPGSVYVLKGTEGKRQSIVETTDSWVYITANDSIEYGRYKAFILALTR